MSTEDRSQDEIEIVPDKQKPQSLLKILSLMFFSIILLGIVIIGGLKLYKHYKHGNLFPKEPHLPIEENHSYVEALAVSQKIPGPPQLKIPEHLEKPIPTQMVEDKKKEEHNITEVIDYSKLPYELDSKKEVKKEPSIEERLNSIMSFDELEKAITSLPIKRVEDKVVVGDKEYQKNEALGSNFIIKKIYRDGNVKIFNIKENYSRRFSL